MDILKTAAASCLCLAPGKFPFHLGCVRDVVVVLGRARVPARCSTVTVADPHRDSGQRGLFLFAPSWGSHCPSLVLRREEGRVGSTGTRSHVWTADGTHGSDTNPLICVCVCMACRHTVCMCVRGVSA